MNVGNVMSTITGQTPALMGANAAQDSNAGLGSLFALQFGDALTNLQQDEPQLGASGEWSGEELAQLTDLLALIQQMLSNSPLQQALPQKAADQQQSIDLLTEKLGGQTSAAVNLNTQQLIDTLTQQGLSQKESMKIVDLLAALAKTSEQPQTPQLNVMAEQAETLLAQFGVKVKKAAPQEELKANFTVKGSFLPVGQQQLLHTAAKPADKVLNQLQPLQYHLALAKYNAEAAVGANTFAANGQQEGTNAQSFTLAEDTEAQPVTTVMPFTSANNANAATAVDQPAENHPVRAEHFNKEVAQVFVKQLQVVGKQGFSEAKLILYPQALGQVDVKITSQNGVITAHFTADTTAGKELLDNQLPQLRAALVQQGLQIDRLEVSQQPQQNQPQFAFQQQREQTRGQQHDGREQRKQGKEEQPEFSIDALVDRNEPITALWNRLRRGNVEYSV